MLAERTRRGILGDVGVVQPRLAVAQAQRPDNALALPPGRYVLHIADVSSDGAKVWVAMGKFAKSVTLVVVASVPHFPMSATGIIAIEVNIRKGDNDQIAAITSAGTANLYITQVSRAA